MIRYFHWENNKHSNHISTSQETRDTKILGGETINGENPATSSKIVSRQDVKPKTVRCPPNTAVAFYLLSSQSISFSKGAPHLREQVM